jgi:hypothetical protein
MVIGSSLEPLAVRNGWIWLERDGTLEAINETQPHTKPGLQSPKWQVLFFGPSFYYFVACNIVLFIEVLTPILCINSSHS